MVMLTACAVPQSPPEPRTLKPAQDTRGHTSPSGSIGPAARVAGGWMGPETASITAEPAVRVRVKATAPTVTLGSTGQTLWIASDGQSWRQVPGPVTVQANNHGLTARATGGLAWQTSRLEATGLEGSVAVDETIYPGRVGVIPGRTATLDVINAVGLERYVAGVVEHEMWATWPAAALEAQAVAARSYALWEASLARQRGRAWDLEATVASQAYGGDASRPGPAQAARTTRGIVIAYQGRVLPTFYSSDSGGAGQDAAAAMPGRGPDLPPLRGRPQGTWGSSGPRHTWGPVTRNTSTLTRRLAAWGNEKRHALANLKSLKTITVTRRNAASRPAGFTVTDRQGQTYTLAPEALRFASNHPVQGLPAITKANQLWSSHLEVNVTAERTVFSSGRGFGHGVGMSQWGAHDLAKAGHAYDAILNFYYPQSQRIALYK